VRRPTRTPDVTVPSGLHLLLGCDVKSRRVPWFRGQTRRGSNLSSLGAGIQSASSSAISACAPPEQHGLATDVVIQRRFQAPVVDHVDLTAEHLLDQLLELDEPERRRPLGRLDQGSVDGPPAVDDKCLSDDVRRGVAGQEQQRTVELGRFT
jgi:hypothetical protein